MSHDHTYVAGEVLTAANLNDLSSATVGSVTATGAQTGISAITDITSLTITFTAIASRRYAIHYRVSFAQQTSTGIVILTVANGSNTALDAPAVTNTAATYGTLSGFLVQTPGAGSITYKLRLSTSAGTVDLNQAAGSPSSLLVVDAGSS
jgi:hypothetical protein